MGCSSSTLRGSAGGTDYAEKNHKRLYQYIQNRNGSSSNANNAHNHHANSLIKPIKMILLGSGESGKSTIVKQMKVIHSNGFDKTEAMTFVPIINSNILTSLVVVLAKVKQKGITTGCQKEIEEFKHFIQNYEEKGNKINQGVASLPEKVCKIIKLILDDKSIMKCIKNARKFGIGDSASHFFSNFDQISAPNYIPTLDDIVRTRVKTVGVHETNFTYKNYQFLLVDVGGQMSERKKWIHCFQEVNIVLFVASLTDYDTSMEEDESKNRMTDSLEIFEAILKNDYFKRTTFVLILNKCDLFKNMIMHTPISTRFPDYRGPDTDFDSSVKFLKHKFLACNGNENRYIYTHVTCATDTSNVEFVFRSVADSLIKQDMEQVLGSQDKL